MASPPDMAQQAPSARSTALEQTLGDASTAHQTSAASTTASTTAPTAPARKQPPPEKPVDIFRRSFVILSFWFIVVCLGLPIWWHTTAIHKAPLPLTRMTEWAEGQACPPRFPIYVQLDAPQLEPQNADKLSQLAQTALDGFNGPAGAYIQLQPRQDASPTPTSDSKTALIVHLEPGNELASSLHSTEPRLDITYPEASLSASSASPLAAYIASQLRDVFAEEKDLVSYYLAQSSIPAHRRNGDQDQTANGQLAKRMTRTLRYAPTYHLTFSLFTSGSSPSAWDIEAAVEEHMRPVLDMLEPIHNFTIDTQIQLYANPSVQSQVLTKEHLPQFINAAEWPLSPSIDGAPTINFVIFAGYQTISAEGAQELTSRSWSIPQWGSVYLLSPPAGALVTSDELKLPVQTFTSHLLSLLGMPQSASPVLRLSMLARVRTIDLMLRASSSLGSLARLTHSLPSISIPASVADGVAKSIQHLEYTCAGLGHVASLQHAQVAEAEAERAFFEKSMVGQLYFPDEHKIAVYLPLLGPVGVPLVMGLLNELKAWKKRRAEKLKFT